MAVTAHYLLLWVLVVVLIVNVGAAFLYMYGKISIEIACLTPMVLLCFVYTPISWFTFDGLVGCTPFLSILYATLITLSYYKRTQVVMLSLYSVQMTGLILHWIRNWPDGVDVEQVVNILIAYVLTYGLLILIVDGVKRKNDEINQRVTELSMRDDLTGLLNRRGIEQILYAVECDFLNESREYAIVMADINQFKRINDAYGHNTGDEAIKSLAHSIKKSIRTKDYAVRFGGDEFLLVLADADLQITQQICKQIEAQLVNTNGHGVQITVSVGFALRSEAASKDELLELADERMYATKQSCRQTARKNI